MSTDVRVERLAEIKVTLKDLEIEAKEIQAELLEEDAGDSLETSYGTLVLGTRTTYECTDKEEVYKNLGQGQYVAASSITLPSIRKVCGAFMADDLEDAEIFRVKSETQYYSLKRG